MLIIQKYFPHLSDEQLTQFEQLETVYSDWNSKINVISRKDIDAFYERHVLHSLGIAKIMPFKNDSWVLDVGTGGGFPGIPLAILFPKVNFHLVDSIGKKIKVVKAVAEHLGLTNVTAFQKRAEEMTFNYDFVVSRAVTKMPLFIDWVKSRFSKRYINELPNGILYLKGGDLYEELSTLQQHYKQFNLSEFFDEPFYETKKVVYVQMN
ncbi:MAG: 16S rRNA (guanine(527)-N(7))-methyltransferase RsmG [Flavobacteriales bacterium]